jgi:PAS domain S-box-containing protein
MKTDQDRRGDLRQEAEERLREHKSGSATSEEMEIGDPLALVQELQVHKIELEMQNEELKRAKLETEVALAKYSNLYDFAPLGLFTLSKDRLILEVNLAGSKLLGMNRRHLMNRRFELFVAPDDRQTFDAFCHQAYSSEIKQNCELRLFTSAGEMIYVYIEDMVIESNEVEHRLAVLDITDRKRMEEELRKSRDELDLRVRARTAELSLAKQELQVANEKLMKENEEHLQLEEELRVARDAAEAAAHVKADFMANMSHEIRTPMNAVIGMTSILMEEPLTPEQKDYVETIRSSGNALLVLINDILDFSRLDREKAELEEQLFDLRSVVEEALDQVASQAAEKRLNLAYIMAKDVPETIYSDPARLRQVLLNLLNNAVKFTEKGEILVSIGHAPAGVRHEIRFSVQDTGIGIPQEQQEKIFEPFSQADTSFARNHDGVGLGLAISRKLVDLMGGKIGVKSEPGKGSNFLFSIMARVLPDEPSKVPAGEQPELKGKKVLVIDESKANRMIIGKQLHEWGMVPLVVASVKDAMDSGYLNYGQDYDAAILGANLEEMERTALVGRMRERSKGLPVILLTPIGTKPTESYASVLPLPIKPLQLFNTMVSIFALAPAQEAVSDEDQAKAAGSLRILLAEDNASSQKVTMQMLKKLGYRADLAANGQEAIEALKRQHYDIVLMDAKMPVLNGWDAAREIRRLWPDNGPKVIALTAYALAGDREKCIESGMDGYIAKPVTLDDLKCMLKKA